MQSTKTRPGADCGSVHQLLIAKFRLKQKKIGKKTRTDRNDLNKILYELPIEVTDRVKGLDLEDSVPSELWTDIHNIVQTKVVNKTISRKNKSKKARKKKSKKVKWLSEDVLQIAEE